MDGGGDFHVGRDREKTLYIIANSACYTFSVYSILDSICSVNKSLFPVSGPICLAIISLFFLIYSNIK